MHGLENTIEDGVEITNSNKLEIPDDNDGKLKIISIDPQSDVKEYDMKEHSDGIEQVLDDEDLKFVTPVVSMIIMAIIKILRLVEAAATVPIILIIKVIVAIPIIKM